MFVECHGQIIAGAIDKVDAVIAGVSCQLINLIKDLVELFDQFGVVRIRSRSLVDDSEGIIRTGGSTIGKGDVCTACTAYRTTVAVDISRRAEAKVGCQRCTGTAILCGGVGGIVMGQRQFKLGIAIGFDVQSSIVSDGCSRNTGSVDVVDQILDGIGLVASRGQVTIGQAFTGLR